HCDYSNQYVFSHQHMNNEAALKFILQLKVREWAGIQLSVGMGYKIILRRLTGYRNGVKLYIAEDAGDGGIGRVSSCCDLNQPIEGSQPGGIEYNPSASEVGFKTGMKVRGTKFIRVPRKISRRNSQSPA